MSQFMSHFPMDYKKTCLFCGKGFTSQRPQTKYCSDGCRKKYQRARTEKKEDQEKRFKGSLIKSPKDVEALVSKEAKEGELSKEEQLLVDQRVLDEKALLKANIKVRAKWVADAYTYKPSYIDKAGIATGKSKYKPYPSTYGAGNKRG